MVYRKSGFRSILFGKRSLPVASVCVQYWENRRVSQRVDAAVQTQSKVGAVHAYCAEFSVGNTESERAIYFRCLNHRQCPLRSSQFPKFQLEHLDDFILL